MSKGQVPGQFRSFPTDLTYSETVDFGNASAGKNNAVSLDGDGKAKLAENNEGVIGTLAEIAPDGSALVEMGGIQIMKQDAVDGVTEGSAIVGGGAISSANGFINTAPAAAAQIPVARGIALEVLSNTAGGEVLVYMGGV